MRASVVAALLALVLVVFVGSNALYTVDQTRQALVLRFGQAEAVVTEPGLHFKEPFVETVVQLDNRILDLESPQEEILASDSQRLLVDAFVRYHIADPLKFYQTVGTVDRANNQLASVLNSAVRRVLGDATYADIIKEKRADLMVAIRKQMDQESAKLGTAINDVRIRRVDLPREVSEQVFNRMKSERSREAAEFRAKGSEQSQTIKAEADRDAVVIKANAQRQADQSRGDGDAERNRIFAEAYGKDPNFFAFYRSMQAYVTGLKSGATRLVLSPDSAFFRFLNSPEAGAKASEPSPVASATPAPPATPAAQP